METAMVVPPLASNSFHAFTAWLTVTKHLRRSTAASNRTARVSIRHNRANRFPLMHQVEALVDPVQRKDVSDQIVDVDLARHVPIHDLRHIGTSPCTPECGSLPHASGHELEWTRLDLLTRARDSDDHRDSPAAMAAF